MFAAKFGRPASLFLFRVYVGGPESIFLYMGSFGYLCQDLIFMVKTNGDQNPFSWS